MRSPQSTGVCATALSVRRATANWALLPKCRRSDASHCREQTLFQVLEMRDRVYLTQTSCHHTMDVREPATRSATCRASPRLARSIHSPGKCAGALRKNKILTSRIYGSVNRWPITGSWRRKVRITGKKSLGDMLNVSGELGTERGYVVFRWQMETRKSGRAIGGRRRRVGRLG